MNPAVASRQTILLAHGGGGQLTDELVSSVVLSRLGNPALGELLDAGLVETDTAARIALTIDSFVVQPLFFPGGDIGRLAVCGTVNDLAVCGAQPLGLALSLILEEGLERKTLERVMDSVRDAAAEAQVSVITGDTKVVGRGQADGMYITTAGVGLVPAGLRLHPDQAREGDLLIINGPLGDHGLAVMLAREMPDVRSMVRSDAAPLNGLIQAVLKRGTAVRFMRDATRGGLAGLAADLAQGSGWRVVLDEEAIPVRPATRHAAQMLGMDWLEIANEGIVALVVPPGDGEAVLSVLREHSYGRQAHVIGRLESPRDGLVELRTAMGGRRIIQKPYGEQLPRIC